MPDLDFDLDLDLIPDEATRHAVLRLLNLVEHLHSLVQALTLENQRLKDEINRLKGEHPKPSFPKFADAKDKNQDARKGKGSGSRCDAIDISSEAERHEPKAHQKRRKLDRLTVDRTQILEIDPASLPHDAQFKGYQDVVVQEIQLRVEVIRFRKPLYYSPSRHKTFTAALPDGYSGEFGPGVGSLALWLVYAGGMSQPDLHSLLNDAGLLISAGQVASLLTQNLDPLHREAQAVGRAGLASSPWQQIDETRTPVNGQNNPCNTVCNPLYSSYRTTPTKERLAIWDVLRAGEPRAFRLDEVAFAYLTRAGLPQKWVRALQGFPPAPEPAGAFDEATFRSLLSEHLPGAGPQQRQRILEAGALSAYQAQETVAVVEMRVCDDAAQFEGVTEERALCWVHEGRHYKKLCPYLGQHRKLLATFREGFWKYYRKLLAYQRDPTVEEAERLWEEFDVVFGQRTGYDELDERIEKTRGKKKELLVVLRHPEVPLHNNASELAARRRVRKRAVSYGPRSEAGKQAWDTLQTLSETAKKLGVSFYHWLKDRVSEANAMPSLAEGIEERAESLKLGASWHRT